MLRAASMDADGLAKLTRKARIEPERREAFRSDMIGACEAYRLIVSHDAKDRPGSEAAALAKIVKSINKFQQAVAPLPEFRRMREALAGAPDRVRGMALPPAGQSGETALSEATLLWLPELLSATADYVAERRDAASARIERHRPAGAAARMRWLALVLWQVAEAHSPRLSARPAEKQGWLYDALTWCGAKPPKRESRRFKDLVKYAAARARPAL